MTSKIAAESDPFADPAIQEEQCDFVGDSTLPVGRNASLTLGTDSLIVLGLYAWDHEKYPTQFLTICR
jgi:hypothetical protein